MGSAIQSVCMAFTERQQTQCKHYTHTHSHSDKKERARDLETTERIQKHTYIEERHNSDTNTLEMCTRSNIPSAARQTRSENERRKTNTQKDLNTKFAHYLSRARSLLEQRLCDFFFLRLEFNQC